MNLDYYIRKKHIFKRRVHTQYIYILHNHSLYSHIYTVKYFRFEFVFLRIFKKLLRRKFIKAKMRFFKPKFWFLMLPNYLLTQKSKNSRMGAGVGKFVRLTSLIRPGKTFIKTWYYSTNYLNYMLNYLKYKIPVKFLLKYVTNKKTDTLNLLYLYRSIFITK